MKISELTPGIIAEYVHIEDDDILLAPCKEAAISYAVNYTGHTAEELDEFEDVTIAVLLKISDFYDQRTEHTDKPVNNPAIETILSMHRVNHLPSMEVEE